MDTRSKKAKFASVMAALLVVVCITTGVMCMIPSLEKRAKAIEIPLGETSSFQWDLARVFVKDCYRAKAGDSGLSPVEVLAPEYAEETKRLARELELAKNGQFETSWQVSPVPTEEPANPATVEANGEVGMDRVTVPTAPEDQAPIYLSEGQREYIQKLNDRVEYRKRQEIGLNESVQTSPWLLGNLDLWAKDTETGYTLSLNQNPEGLFEDKKKLENYQYAVELELTAAGELRVVNQYSSKELSDYHEKNLIEIFETEMRDGMGNYSYVMVGPNSYNTFETFVSEDTGSSDALKITNYKNVRMIMAVPKELRSVDAFYYDAVNTASQAYYRAGFAVLSAAAMVLAALFGLGFGLIKKWQVGEGKIMRFLPVEGIVIGDILLVVGVFASRAMVESLVSMRMGLPIRQLASDWMVQEALVAKGLGILYLLTWAGIVLACYLSFLSYAKIFTKGLWPYLKERSWLVRLCYAVCHGVKKIWNWATDVQLSGSESKWLWRLALVNSAAIVLMCCGWFFAIPVALIYSAVTYVLLKKKCAKIRADYEKVLNVAHKMADGDLDAADDENVGIYEPLKQDMGRVREGFQKAVDAEIKSQSMKTELITNVSHDLKTPLTAIITYVDLLKKPDITEEERQSYIETLDKKSQRLKQLIADLFDVSKAVSRDMTPDLVPLDLAALLRQVRFELDDRLTQSSLNFRWDIPEEKVPVLLDGARTGRIFENLLVNITKYALPGTRAYVAMTRDESEVQVSFKNVSAAELPEDPDALAERFVRGDASRSTEGSGLGLAIVRSFTELQGGRLELLVDGDLFKAVVHFPLNKEPADKIEPEQQEVCAEQVIVIEDTPEMNGEA